MTHCRIFALRLPNKILAELDAASRARFESRATIIRRALVNELGLAPPKSDHRQRDGSVIDLDAGEG